jgi:ribosomal protein S18 acetylase RimI-like enzyme
VNIVPVTNPDQLREVRRLFEEYAASLSFDLCFQNFQQELDGLPGDYAPPVGGLWLATDDRGKTAGCVALRRLEPGVGEMKRLNVRPEQRGTGLGKRLTLKVLEEAGAIGYRRIRLDTTPEMAGAIRLYDSLGCTRIAPYLPNPIEGAMKWRSKWALLRRFKSSPSPCSRSNWSLRCSTLTVSSTASRPTSTALAGSWPSGWAGASP